MALSAANVIQAKTGSASAGTAPVALDAGTQAGSTVTVEISTNAVPIMDSGLPGHVPAGFEFDAYSNASGAHYLHAFHKCAVAAGEGVAGSTSWDFSFSPTTNWSWRATEWDTALDPVSPLETATSSFDTGTAPAGLSTGTTTQTGRADLVCLAWHEWVRSSNTAQSMTWSGHTNGFAIRDSLRWTGGTAEFGDCWSWAFPGAAGAFETTATINLATRAVNDVYVALLVVYAAVVPVPVSPGAVVVA